MLERLWDILYVTSMAAELDGKAEGGFLVYVIVKVLHW